MSANQEIENTNEVPRRRLLPRPNQVEKPIEIPPVIRERTPTPEKCRLEHYQKRPLSYKEIKNKITNITFLPDGKKIIDPKYLQEMLEMSTKRRFGKEAKYPNEKYCDVVKNKPSYIAWLLQNRDCIVPEQLRDYCFISVHERHFK
jgi:hypothetical protein